MTITQFLRKVRELDGWFLTKYKAIRRKKGLSTSGLSLSTSSKAVVH